MDFCLERTAMGFGGGLQFLQNVVIEISDQHIRHSKPTIQKSGITMIPPRSRLRRPSDLRRSCRSVELEHRSGRNRYAATMPPAPNHPADRPRPVKMYADVDRVRAQFGHESFWARPGARKC